MLFAYRTGMETMITLRAGLSVLLALCLAACASSGGKRVSEPAASIQQLTVDARGGWTVELRLQNYSSVSMRFDSVNLALTVGGVVAGTLSAQPALAVAAESADVVQIRLAPSAEARLQVADALASGRSLPYSIDGQVSAAPDDRQPRSYRLRRESALSATPGLPGVLR